MNQKTLFIAFEGLDGSGKDTQLNLLIDEIKSSKNKLFGDKYSNIWITRQPTKMTPSGIAISEKIKSESVSKEEATQGFVQDRIEHSQIIREQLQHSFVLTSRSDFSTLCYQSAQGMDVDELYELHQYGDETGTLIPDITLVFKIPAEVGLSRIQEGRQEVAKECFEELEFLKKCSNQEEFLIPYLKNKDGRIIIEINANQSIEEVKNEMVSKLEVWWSK